MNHPESGVDHEEMGCNLCNSRNRLNAGASLGTFASSCAPYRLSGTFADGFISSDQPIHENAFILYRDGRKQRYSVGCDWRSISGNLQKVSKSIRPSQSRFSA